MRAFLIVMIAVSGCASEVPKSQDFSFPASSDLGRDFAPDLSALAPDLAYDLMAPTADLSVPDDDLTVPVDDLAVPVDDLTAPPDQTSEPVQDAATPPDLFDACTTLSCQNGGTCVVGDSGATCACVAGYSGPLCATNIDDCTPNPCATGHLCTDLVDGYACSCPEGFAGPTCACQTGALIIKYYLRDTMQVASVDDVPPGIHVTGSSKILVSGTGLGVVGGVRDYEIDTGETIDFKFDYPAQALTVVTGNFDNVNGNGSDSELTIEAFSPAGVSLGTRAATFSYWDITSMYGGAAVGRVKITGTPDGVTIPRLFVTFDCE